MTREVHACSVILRENSRGGGILLRSDRIFAYFIEKKDYLLADLLNPGEGAAALVHSQKGFAPD
ncbi:conserved protein of unknown function [Acidithiobacillus ferrivorans]|uniref:Uncharacterized protein n=1 Tax=Acidithiobacillus ferrivorans TaxID=160808 RepID=A0A060UXL4_9PROT|nr:hypothetical protein [Acidithiobacillus ferrivorans]CDQ11448.1 conserved hypothetical protein [Acidithiobacillus ferrivorans]SMH66272.1 conserved protein of unknown function [Acidithiobacillus ferrivorans]